MHHFLQQRGFFDDDRHKLIIALGWQPRQMQLA